jgi:hypothetical protein
MTVENAQPVVICEIGGGCKDFGYEPAELFRWFKNIEYLAFFYNGKKMISCTHLDKGNTNSNYFFIPSVKYEALSKTTKLFRE